MKSRVVIAVSTRMVRLDWNTVILGARSTGVESVVGRAPEPLAISSSVSPDPAERARKSKGMLLNRA